MAARTNCPNCGKPLVAPDDARGKKVRCKYCQVCFVVSADLGGISPNFQSTEDVTDSRAHPVDSATLQFTDLPSPPVIASLADRVSLWGRVVAVAEKARIGERVALLLAVFLCAVVLVADLLIAKASGLWFYGIAFAAVISGFTILPIAFLPSSMLPDVFNFARPFNRREQFVGTRFATIGGSCLGGLAMMAIVLAPRVEGVLGLFDELPQAAVEDAVNVENVTKESSDFTPETAVVAGSIDGRKLLGVWELRKLQGKEVPPSLRFEFKAGWLRMTSKEFTGDRKYMLRGDKLTSTIDIDGNSGIPKTAVIQKLTGDVLIFLEDGMTLEFKRVK
jgi:hypothetical protein